jgi:cytochrome c oxidase subunit 3
VSERAFLQEPFEDISRQHEAVSFGMWVFLVSEVLLFAGLFAGYGIYRLLYGDAFVAAARQTDILYGTVNTALLMTSSLAIAISGRAARAEFYRLSYVLLITTFCLGAIFLVIKGFEYAEDIEKHLLPGAGPESSAAGAQQFFTFYWVMTGVHALHVTAGLIALSRLMVNGARNLRWLAGSASEEATALYWHLVDVIWIVLYPLLYLVGRSHG